MSQDKAADVKVSISTQPKMVEQTATTSSMPITTSQGMTTTTTYGGSTMIKDKDYIDQARTSDIRISNVDTAGSLRTSNITHQIGTNLSAVTLIDKKIIVEKIAETHFETQYVQKTIGIPTPIQQELTLVTAIQETKKVPVTKLVEVVEQVPIKVVEEVIEYKTIPVTRFEEVIEQVPVKKFVPRTEYKKVPVTKLVERTENVSVKRVEERTDYVTFTTTTPINPTPLENFHEAHSGIIHRSSVTGLDTNLHGNLQQSNLQGNLQTNLQWQLQHERRFTKISHTY